MLIGDVLNADGSLMAEGVTVAFGDRGGGLLGPASKAVAMPANTDAILRIEGREDQRIHPVGWSFQTSSPEDGTTRFTSVWKDVG